jgi:AraC-like DNA-binding protein
MIGKTRQRAPRGFKETYDPEVGRARGVVRRPLLAGAIKHSRRSPAPDLSRWIAHYWSVKWDLPAGKTYTAGTLPHPNVHLIFEEGRCAVSGARTRKFIRILRGRSEVFGIKFQPGAFRLFSNAPVSALANRVIPARRIFGASVGALGTKVLAARTEKQRIDICNAFFRSRVPKPDPAADLARRLVVQILNEAPIKTVEDLAYKSGITKRSLQRIFKEYVGVSPKWAIRRYRLHELVERIQSGERPDWAQLALDFGYFDQAHLINDFKSVVGFSPTQFAKLTGPAG